mmetsp:Transcript_56329/g.163390  ORF Transcript_56329/g.163390 Transcript_56329/m.163390 type:complete len:287 (+) Transcript_56329:534-1394(+)
MPRMLLTKSVCPQDDICQEATGRCNGENPDDLEHDRCTIQYRHGGAMFQDDMPDIPHSATEAGRGYGNVDVGVFADEFNNLLDARTTTEASGQDAVDHAIVPSLFVLGLGPQQELLEQLQNGDKGGAGCQRTHVVSHTTKGAFNDPQTISFSVAVLVGLRLVILGYSIRDGELIQSSHERQHPHSDEDVNCKEEVLLLGEMVKALCAGACNRRRGPEVNEANEENKGEDALHCRLDERRQQEQWHLPNNFRPTSDAGGRELDLSMATTCEACQCEGRDPGEDGKGL